jgi:hypothetical protein
MAEATTLPSFNPTGDQRVAKIKGLTEEVLAYLRDLRDGTIPQNLSGPDTAGLDRQAPDARCLSIAITNYEQAAMWAVKSLFVK